MRTIDIYLLTGDNQQLLARMHFLNDADFNAMATRVTSAAPCNSLRYDRQEVGLIRLVSLHGRKSEYYADPVTSKLINLCTIYAIIYGHARKMAQSAGWQFAWRYATPAWRQKATLRHMRKAQRLLLKDHLVS